jgi:hypothetical protein
MSVERKQSFIDDVGSVAGRAAIAELFNVISIGST